MSKNIVLVGMMGCGKTSVGKYLLNLFDNYSFVDIDDEIVKNMEMSINEIFSKYGEDYFREIEKNEVNKFSTQSNLIISTGGGVVNSDDNISSLKKNGILFFLKASPEILYNRIQKENTRPLLKTENPLGKIKDLLKIRENKYMEADFCIDTELLSVEEVALEIKKYYDIDKN